MVAILNDTKTHCFDVDETQTKRCEKQNKKIKTTRTNIYNKQAIIASERDSWYTLKTGST
jgi:hypothetical protein